MKTSIGNYFLLIVITFSVCCSKKDEVKNSTQTKSIQVVEYKTDLPIIGALVEYYEFCPSCNGGSGGYNIVISKTTGYGGTCEIPQSIFINTLYGIVITPPTPAQTTPPVDYYYWPTGSPAAHSLATKYALPVTGEERLHLLKTNDFPKGRYMKIFALGELDLFQVIDVAYINGLPSDTTFDFYTYRGQTNTIICNVYDSTDAVISSTGPLKVDFPKTGKNEFELKY